MFVHQGPEIGTNLFQFLWQFAQDLLLVEELALVPVLKVLCDSGSHFPWELSIGHVLFHLFDLGK